MTRALQTTFSALPALSSRSTSSPAFQYHAVLPSVSHLSRTLQRTVCPATDARCRALARSLESATYLDLDYDASHRSLVATAFWARPPPPAAGAAAAAVAAAWHDDVTLPSSPGDHRVEIGVLGTERAVSPARDEVTLGGVLSVLGESDAPSTCSSPKSTLTLAPPHPPP